MFGARKCRLPLRYKQSATNRSCPKAAGRLARYSTKTIAQGDGEATAFLAASTAFCAASSTLFTARSPAFLVASAALLVASFAFSAMLSTAAAAAGAAALAFSVASSIFLLAAYFDCSALVSMAFLASSAFSLIASVELFSLQAGSISAAALRIASVVIFFIVDLPLDFSASFSSRPLREHIKVSPVRRWKVNAFFCASR